VAIAVTVTMTGLGKRRAGESERRCAGDEEKRFHSAPF
jgi:hypothetical protein